MLLYLRVVAASLEPRRFFFFSFFFLNILRRQLAVVSNGNTTNSCFCPHFSPKETNCSEKQHVRASFQVMRMLKCITTGQKHVGHVLWRDFASRCFPIGRHVAHASPFTRADLLHDFRGRQIGTTNRSV